MNVHETKIIFDIFERVKIERPRYFRGRGRQMGYNLFSGRNPETICWFDIWKELFTSSWDVLKSTPGQWQTPDLGCSKTIGTGKS